MEQLHFSATPSRSSYDLKAGSHPHFLDQASDDARQELIKSASETEHGIGSDTSISANVPKARSYTERVALDQTKNLLEEAITNPDMPEDVAKRAEDIYENLTFIGEKELIEATYAIAEYWKSYLRNNSDSSLFIITSKSFETESLNQDGETIDDDLGFISNNKSDEYILDRVLSNFSDEEIREYSSRLLFTESEYHECTPSKVKAVILDDWIMSGQQMQDALNGIFEHITPADMEINLVTASEGRLTNGFKTHHRIDPIPIKARFMARPANHPYASEFGGAYLTAAHSTGDYPFEGSMQDIIGALNKAIPNSGEKLYMPPLANIVRPYYSPDYRPRNIERVRLQRAMASKVILSSKYQLI